MVSGIPSVSVIPVIPLIPGIPEIPEMDTKIGGLSVTYSVDSPETLAGEIAAPATISRPLAPWR